MGPPDPRSYTECSGITADFLPNPSKEGEFRGIKNKEKVISSDALITHPRHCVSLSIAMACSDDVCGHFSASNLTS
jgi:hypothetical protein